MNDTLGEAFQFFKGGENQKAAKLLAALVIQEPNNANAWLGLGVCLDDEDKQIYCFQKVLSIEPDNSQAKEMLEKLSPRLDTKECPYCEESIPEEADWCRNCGRDLRVYSTVETESRKVPLPGLQPEGPGIETKECAHCGESNPDGLNWCRNCGGDLRESPTVEKESSEVPVPETQTKEPRIEPRECPYCGVPIHEGANWCRNCGRNLRDIPALEEETSEVQVPSAEPETIKIQQYPEYQPVERKAEKTKRFRPLLVGVIIIALIGVIGSLMYTFYRMDQVSQAEPESLVFSPNPTNTSRPQTASPITDPNPETSTITPPYFEDFSNGPGIWHVRTDDDVSFSVSDRKYVIKPKNPGGSWWTSPNAKIDDVRLEFTTSFLYSYPMEDGGFRVNFRCVDTDAEDCYKMYVSENGYLFVHRDENTLVDHKLSQYINLYDNPNHWEIVMDGSDFEIRCNGELLATFSDSKLKSGDFGFGVFNSENDEWGFNGVAFDDIRVTSLE